MPVFEITCKLSVRAKNKEDAELRMKEEFGEDYDKRMSCSDALEDTKQEVDFDLINDN